MSWEPDPGQLQQVCEMLNVLSLDPTHPAYRQTEQQVGQELGNPAFVMHLCFVFASLTPDNVPNNIRQLAGLVLKQVVKNQWNAHPPEVQAFFRAQMLQASGDMHSHEVRQAASNVITTIASFTRLEEWPELMPTLIAKLDSAQVHLLPSLPAFPRLLSTLPFLPFILS